DVLVPDDDDLCDSPFRLAGLLGRGGKGQTRSRRRQQECGQNRDQFPAACHGATAPFGCAKKRPPSGAKPPVQGRCLLHSSLPPKGNPPHGKVQIKSTMARAATPR